MRIGRALTAVGAALVLALLVLGLVIYVNRDENGIAVDNLLAEDITRSIATAEDRGGDVDLGRVAKFEWDELVIAERDATRAQLTRELGFPWEGDLEFRTGDILIFLRKGELARFADYRGEGRFAGIQRPFARFERANAVFRVRGLVIRPLKPPS
ncbi:MAG: hypothetical protein ABI611_04700 [Solirubrobacteraceae bacterium]